MLVDTVELTMSHLDLGRMSEFALMTLFGNAHSHCLTKGTGGSIRNIVDGAGAPLYPGYYWTHLKVPPKRLLRDVLVWDTVGVGVDVQAFGGLLLTSSYALGTPAELEKGLGGEVMEALPSMRAGNTFYVDGVEGEPRPSAPKAGTVAELPRLKETPVALNRFREVRARASIDPTFDGTLATREPLPYQLVFGRDLQPEHGIMFARYVVISDTLERQFLSQEVWPPFSEPLLGCLSVIERETFYFANVRRAHLLRANLRCKLQKLLPGQVETSKDMVAAGLLTTLIEIYADHGALLLMAKAQKLLAVPRAEQAVLAHAEMLLARHAQGERS